jgi:hypothetical protein
MSTSPLTMTPRAAAARLLMIIGEGSEITLLTARNTAGQ